MKKIVFLIVLVIFSSCSSVNITDFDSCVKAGNAVMESYPRQCSDGENTYVEVIDEPRICTLEYAPVCAQVEVQCVREPCNPINETFSNRCMAGDNKILYEGECKN